jgi:hypoxanthine phosphoribosyltransferase
VSGIAAKKLYLDAQALLEDAFRLAAMIHDSGFRPTFVVAVWRGGAPIGIAVQEYFACHGVRTDHIAIRTRAYEAGAENPRQEINVQGLDYLADRVTPEDRVLIVDDVHDTGRSIEAIIRRLEELCRRNMPLDVRVAVPWFKPARNRTSRVPDYYLHETDAWLKFPHSLEGLTLDEIRAHRPQLWDILREHLK